MAVLAIDQGTTSTRALTLTDAGDVRLSEALRHHQSHGDGGRVEHNADELMSNIVALIEAHSCVDQIAIDNQGESCLAWDSHNQKAISPVIVWQDSRTHELTDRLKSQGAEALTLKRAGLPIDPYFSASKLSWLFEHVPRAKQLHRLGRLCLGTTDAFFLHRLTGTFATDPSTASRTSLMNLNRGTWDAELCRLFGVPMDALPEIRPTVGDFGVLRRGGTPVTVSVVDQQASLYGHSCRAPGDVKITFGTGAFALSLTGSDRLDLENSGLLATVAWGDPNDKLTYALDGGVYNAGSAVEWVRRLGLFDELQELADLEGESAIERGLVFVPALSGLAAPHWDRTAAGLWIGMELETSRADLVRAVLEGVAFRAAEIVSAMNAICPLQQTVSIDGGLTQNGYFCQFLADVLERTVSVAGLHELTALGCASMAMPTIGDPCALGGDRVRFEPARGDSAQWRERFRDARQRAMAWRG